MLHRRLQMVQLLLKGLGIPPLKPFGSLPFLTHSLHVSSEGRDETHRFTPHRELSKKGHFRTELFPYVRWGRGH